MNSRLHNQQGFTLVELAIVLMIVALLLGGMLLTLGSQDELRKIRDTQKTLEEANSALVGYAASNGRLPCPASSTSNGVNSYCTNETGLCGTVIVPPTGVRPDHGRCSNPYDGFLPGVTLGLSGVDANGYVTDAWGSESNRIRYAIYSALNTSSGAINAVNHPFTATTGMKTATMSSIAGRTPLLSVCNTAAGITNAGTATAQCPGNTTLTNSAVAVVFSLGKNAPTGVTGTDEAVNLDADPVFVSHSNAQASAPAGEYDDLVIWLSPNILFNRMITASTLP